jgi:hypothetical protein
MWSYRTSRGTPCQSGSASAAAVLLLALFIPDAATAAARERVLVITTGQSSPVQQNAVSLFARRMRELRRADVEIGQLGALNDGRASVDMLVVAAVAQHGAIRPDLTRLRIPDAPKEPDSFALSTIAGDDGSAPRDLLVSTRTIAIVNGHDARGLLYGLGRLLRLASSNSGASLVAPRIEERHTPAIRDRGVYFATHFQNFYEGAPLEEIDRYVEEMALWGFDQVHFWFDMNWFPEGFWRDAGSPGMRMITRLRRISATAHSYGLEVGAVGVANEGFRLQPPASLKADASARRGGYYPDSTICPSREGGMNMILDDRRRVLELLGPIDVFTYWPYDSGGCGCALCMSNGSWGATFLKIGPQISQLVKQINPGARFYVSTWYMDPKERQLVYDQMKSSAPWFDGTVSETKYEGERGALGLSSARYAKLVFPEISMFDSYGDGYGTNGANPAPDRFIEVARRTVANGFGTELYSEGFYDDLNKVVWVSILWDPNRTATEIIGEYCNYYFGAKAAPAALELITGLEQTWGAAKLSGAGSEQVQHLANLAESLQRAIPADAGQGQARARALHDRAEMDALMKRIGPDRQLARASRLLFEEAGYVPDAAALRAKATGFLNDVKSRQMLIDQLFEVHWNYLEYFHMEKTTLAFLPDKMLGRIDWAPLIAPLEKALAEKDDNKMREAILKTIRRWWWFNGLTAENYFLL